MPQPPLEPDEMLVRGIPKNRPEWDEDLKSVVPTDANYKLRPGEEGLSAERIKLTSYDDASQKNRFVGFTQISVRRVLDLGLGIAVKETSDSGVNITGLPAFEEAALRDKWGDILANVFCWARMPPVHVVERVHRNYLKNHHQAPEQSLA